MRIVQRSRSPALHMVVLGAAMFAWIEVWGEGATGKPRIEIPASRVEQVQTDYLQRAGRPPSGEEWQALRGHLIDEEILVRYAISLGMHADPAARTRLAQLARFVGESVDGAAPEQELVQRAIDLGFHQRDLIVRRILADRARRLIRAVVLTRQPSDRATEAFYAANAEAFRRPEKVGFSLITINTFKWPDTEGRARELRARLDAQELDFDAAMALSDESVAEPVFAASSRQEVERQMGPGFADAVFELPVGRWSAPIRSRHGHHLVYLEGRVEAQVPPLAEVRSQVERHLSQALADQWLAERVEQLRGEYQIVVAGEVS